jgi:hypothetical protein
LAGPLGIFEQPQLATKESCNVEKLMLFGGLTILIGGILSAGGAILNLGIFMDHPKVQPIIQSLGRTGARVFYIVLGMIFILAGTFMTYRGIQLFQEGS